MVEEVVVVEEVEVEKRMEKERIVLVRKLVLKEEQQEARQHNNFSFKSFDSTTRPCYRLS